MTKERDSFGASPDFREHQMEFFCFLPKWAGLRLQFRDGADDHPQEVFRVPIHPSSFVFYLLSFVISHSSFVISGEYHLSLSHGGGEQFFLRRFVAIEFAADATFV